MKMYSRCHFCVFLALLLLLFIGCQNTRNDSTNGLIINYNQKNEVRFEDYFDTKNPTIIQFEQNDSILLSNSIVTKLADNLLFVYDAITVQLYVFNSHGKFLNKIGTCGEGPIEYTEILSYEMDTSTKTVDLLTTHGGKIKTYTYSGDFVNSFSTPKTTYDFAKAKHNHYWLFTGFSDDSHYRVHLFNTNSIVESFLPTKEETFEFTEQKFFGQNGYGLFRESFLPTIYKYDSINFTEAYYMDFGKETVSEDELIKFKDPLEYLERINRNGVYSSIQAFEDSLSVYIKTIFQINEEIEIADFIINKEDNSITKITFSTKSQELAQSLKLVALNNGKYLFTAESGAVIDCFETTTDTEGNLIDADGSIVLVELDIRR